MNTTCVIHAQLAGDTSEIAPTAPGEPEAPAAAPSAHFEDAVLHNSADFYKWHSELEATWVPGVKAPS